MGNFLWFNIPINILKEMDVCMYVAYANLPVNLFTGVKVL